MHKYRELARVLDSSLEIEEVVDEYLSLHDECKQKEAMQKRAEL